MIKYKTVINMKRIYNIIFTIVLISIILIVYLNIDRIVNKTIKIFGDNKKIVLNNESYNKRTYSNIHFKTFKTEDDYIPYNKEDIKLLIYNVLNNGWDKFTFYCPKEYKSCKNDVEEVTNDKKALSGLSNYVSPYNSYKKISTSVYVDGKVDLIITKNYTKEEIERIKPEIKNIISKLNPNLSTKKKIIKIHDYYVMKTKYDKTRSELGKSNYSSNKAIGPLFENYAICSGFADTMALFLDELGVPNIKIASDKHVWNLAYVDGKWLHIDLTWDLPLENTSDNIHTFLLINTKTLKDLDTKEHIWDNDFYLEAN